MNQLLRNQSKITTTITTTILNIIIIVTIGGLLLLSPLIYFSTTKDTMYVAAWCSTRTTLLSLSSSSSSHNTIRQTTKLYYNVISTSQKYTTYHNDNKRQFSTAMIIPNRRRHDYMTRSSSSSSTSSITNEQVQHPPISDDVTSNDMVVESIAISEINNTIIECDNTIVDSPTISNDTHVNNSTKSRTSKKKEIVPPPPPLPTPTDFPEWTYQDRNFFRFELIHQSTISNARVGRIHTPHGIIDTPAFVAVATNGALKGIDFRAIDSMGQSHHDNDTSNGSISSSSSSSSQLIFCNTYHLMIQPGADVIGDAGGIHEYTKRRNGPFITDSGGFQVFSLAYGSVAEDLASKGELKRSTNKKGHDHHHGQLDGADAVQVTEDGAIFRSYRDGNKLLLTPETTVQAQKLIGADIIIPLDELPGYYVDRERLVESVARTHRWEARSLQEHLKNVQQQAMYCVIHGGMDYELRKESVDYLTSLPFDGYGIGGSLGNGRQELQELLSWLMPMFNENDNPRIKSKPRHLLGIADEESIRNAIPTGIDTFDSCYPTRLGRHGTVLTRKGTVKLQSGIHTRSYGIKIDEECTCTTCQTYDRAYICHLLKANEPLATTLAATHNLHYMYDLMAQLRQDILDNKI